MPQFAEFRVLFFLADGLDCLLHHRLRDPIGDHNHRRPLPVLLMTLSKCRHVISPPQPFQRRNNIILTEFLLAHEFQRVGNRIQNFYCVHVIHRSIRIALAVHHQILQWRNGDDRKIFRRRLVQIIQLFFEINFLHRRASYRPDV